MFIFFEKMEEYNNSVQGVCLINNLHLPIELIKKIRYYCNFSVDITGYSKDDLLRIITKDNSESYKLYNEKNKQELIRILYNKKIHLQPTRKKCKNVLGTIIKQIVSINVIRDMFVTKIKYGIDSHQLSIFIGYTYKYYDYLIYVKHVTNKNVLLRIEKQFHDHTKYVHIWYKLDHVVFLHINIFLKAEHFRPIKYQQLQEYMKLIQNFHISDEKYINEKFLYECANEGLRHIDYCLAKKGKILYD